MTFHFFGSPKEERAGGTCAVCCAARFAPLSRPSLLLLCLLLLLAAFVFTTVAVVEVPWMSQHLRASPSATAATSGRSSSSSSSNATVVVVNATAVTDEWLSNCVRNFPEREIIPFRIKPGFDLYRLGDCIKSCASCSRLSRKNPKPTPEPPNAVSLEYEALACPPDRTARPNNATNLLVLGGILRRRAERDPTFVKPDPDALVVHLRLGDQIEQSESTAEQMLTKGADPFGEWYRDSIKSAHELISNARDSGCRKVVLVGGSHKSFAYEKSRVYAGCLYRALVRATTAAATASATANSTGSDDSDRNKTVVTLQIDGSDADHDLYYMSYAKHFVQSAGGYSRLVGQMVEYNGDNVVGRKT